MAKERRDWLTFWDEWGKPVVQGPLIFYIRRFSVKEGKKELTPDEPRRTRQEEAYRKANMDEADRAILMFNAQNAAISVVQVFKDAGLPEHATALQDRLEELFARAINERWAVILGTKTPIISTNRNNPHSAFVASLKATIHEQAAEDGVTFQEALRYQANLLISEMNDSRFGPPVDPDFVSKHKQPTAELGDFPGFETETDTSFEDLDDLITDRPITEEYSRDPHAGGDTRNVGPRGSGRNTKHSPAAESLPGSFDSLDSFSDPSPPTIPPGPGPLGR